MATIIGFDSSPRPTEISTLGRRRPSRAPVMTITISEPNTTRSIARTVITGPIAASPSSRTSMGMPRKPTLPIVAHCASIAATGAPVPRRSAITATTR